MTILQGERVMLERRRIDMNQDALGKLAGVDQSYISRLEKNRIKNVGVDTIAAIADGLGVTIPYLLGLSDSPLGESDARVLRELAGESVAIDVDSDDERRLVRLLRQAVAPAPEPAPVERMEEGEWEMWVRLLNRFDEPTRRAIERSVGMDRDVAGAGR